LLNSDLKGKLKMFLGKVVGTLVASQKEATLEGLKFLVVRRLTIDNQDTDGYVVAADAVGAGVGEVVMVATGSSARQTKLTDRRPADAVIMAIVDTWEVDGQEKYRKDVME
jgi:microcompartment protein CcmK/EutM